MHALFRLFLDVLLRRRGPEDVPPSWALAGVVSVASMAVNALYVAKAVPDGHWALRTLGDFAAGALFLAFILLLARLLPRFLQSFTAMAGTSTLLGLPALALLALAQTGWRPLQTVLNLAFTMLLVASLFVTEHILRRTLECSVWRSIPLTFANFLLSLGVAQWFDTVFRPGA